MTFATRDEYRHVVERIAKRTRKDEAAVARVGLGLAEPEQALGYRLHAGEALYRWVLRHPNLSFVGGMLVATAAALAALFWLAGPAARSAVLLVVLFALLPANDIAVNFVNQLVTVL